MTPREHLKASIEHYTTSGRTAEDWVKMDGYKIARSIKKDHSISVTDATETLLEMSDEELNETWAKWQIEKEET